ncbi:MAG: methyl-accepting chemotaxis protein [Lachnospiraceae bacterium]|nr:methyl-accepting chemotaxis protein [Lachnospiraceae bacterium]MDD5853432.1 methyl-accepting chemotaxis protein [Lachnospiraceae bacterium]
MTKKTDIKLNIKWKLLIYSVVPLIATFAELMLGIRIFYGKEILASVKTPMLLIFILNSVIMFFVMQAFAWKLGNSVDRIIATLDRAGSGDLTAELGKIDLERKDEIGVLADHANMVIGQLKDVIGQVGNTSDVIEESTARLDKMAEQTSTASEDVARSMGDMANGATAQASETQAVSDAIGRIGEGIEETSNAVAKLIVNADQMKAAGQEGVDSVGELKTISEKVKAQIAVIYEQTNTTNESAQEIHKATELISSIASETNLLALNASIEAARAGESGRGFAVVAEQIKNLAEQSNQSAKTIEGIINNLLADTEQAVKTMNTVDAIIGFQADKVEMTKRVFDKVNNGLIVTMEGVESIAQSTKNLDEAKGRVIMSVESLSAIAEENAASTQETAASAEELTATIGEIKNATSRLNQVADDLTTQTNRFQIYL